MARFCLLVLAITSAYEAARIPSSWYGRQSREAGMNPVEGKLYWHFVICMKLYSSTFETRCDVHKNFEIRCEIGNENKIPENQPFFQDVMLSAMLP